MKQCTVEVQLYQNICVIFRGSMYHFQSVLPRPECMRFLPWIKVSLPVSSAWDQHICVLFRGSKYRFLSVLSSSEYLCALLRIKVSLPVKSTRDQSNCALRKWINVSLQVSSISDQNICALFCGLLYHFQLFQNKLSYPVDQGIASSPFGLGSEN